MAPAAGIVPSSSSILVHHHPQSLTVRRSGQKKQEQRNGVQPLLVSHLVSIMPKYAFKMSLEVQKVW